MMTRLFLVLLALTLAVPAQAQPLRAGATLDGIAAVVGDQVVLRSEVEAAATQIAQGQPVTDAVWSRALDGLVDTRVLVVQAERDTTLTITEAQITQQVDARIDGFLQQVGSEEALAEALGKPVGEFKASIRQDVRAEILAQQYRSRRLREVAVSPNEVRAWYERIPEAELPMVPELVRVAHIVAKPQPNEASRTAARAEVQAYRDSILAGQATIEELAARHTDDGGSRANGGAYEDFAIRDLVPEFGAVASRLEPGALSQVFETEYGFHVLRLNARVGDRVSFNHILINIDADAGQAEVARERLSVLRDSVVTLGRPFEAIAREHSEDPYSASRGGFVSNPQTGERTLVLEALGPQWAATIADLAEGEISEPAPVQLQDGTSAFHVVLLQKRTAPHRLSLTEDYQLLSEYALNEKRQTVLTDWVRRLRQDVYVDIRDERYAPAGV